MVMANGTSPTQGAEGPIPRPDLDATAKRSYELLDEIAAGLRAQIAMEQAGRAEIEQAVRDSHAREKQLQRTLSTLEKKADAEEAKASKPGRKGARAADWQPSEATLAKVWQATVAYAGEHPEFTMNKVAKAADGLSQDVVRKAMPIFRQRELVRVVGKVQGGGVAWALMPGAEFAGLSSDA